jgi:hypothetical protein
MPNLLVHYLGVLANGDDTALGMPLQHGLHVEVVSFAGLLSLLSQLRRAPQSQVASQMMRSPVPWFPLTTNPLDGTRALIVRAEFHADIELDTQGFPVNSLAPDLVKHDNSVIQQYLNPLLQALRLFADGNLCKLSDEYYFESSGEPRRVIGRYGGRERAQELWQLPRQRSDDLAAWLPTVSFGSAKEYVRIATDLYEESFAQASRALSVITLVTALEVLFEAGAAKVARRMAVLLGTTLDESRSISEQAMGLHKIRSEAIHSGRFRDISPETVVECRKLARRCIKRVLDLSLDRKKLHICLDEHGFGEAAKIG